MSTSHSQSTGAAAVTTASDLKRLDLSNTPDIKERLPLSFAELDRGRSTKLKERAAQIVLIYYKAIHDGYISQRDLNLFESAVFNLRDVPFRQIDKKYPPVRNPDHKRLEEDRLVANAALNQWRQAFMAKGGTNADLWKCKDPQLVKLEKASRKYDWLSDKLPNPDLPKELFKDSRVVSAATLLTHSHISGARLEEIEKLPEHPVKKMALDAYQEITILQDAKAQLKALVKTSAQIKAIGERKRMPETTLAAFKTVEDILTKMTDQVKAEYVKYHYDKTTTEIADFLTFDRTAQLRALRLDKKSQTSLKASNESAKAKFMEETGCNWGYREEKRAVHWIETWFQLLTGDLGFDIEEQPLKALKNWKALVLDYFTAQAENIQKFFVERAGEKIAVIVEAKKLKGEPKILNATAAFGVIEGNIKFEFKDGSYFTVRHKVVEKGLTHWRDDKVTTFCQFPTTFHNAVLANGKEMPGQPSEQEMKTLFIGETKTEGELRREMMIHKKQE